MDVNNLEGYGPKSKQMRQAQVGNLVGRIKSG